MKLQLSLFVYVSLLQDLNLHHIMFIWDPQHLAHTRHTDLWQKQEGVPKYSLSKSLIYCPKGKNNKQGESLWLEPRRKYFFKSPKISESSQVWEQAFLSNCWQKYKLQPAWGERHFGSKDLSLHFLIRMNS